MYRVHMCFDAVNLNADHSDTGYTKLVSFYKFKCEVKSGENC